MKSFNTYSFGCRVNKAEIEALESALSTLGYTKDENNPKIFIINTCSVTHKAEREAQKYIHSLKRRVPKTKIVVTGCAATNWLKLNKKMNGVDFLVDNSNKPYLAELLEKKYFTGMTIIKKGEEVSSAESILDIHQRSKRIMIKIQDGCHRFCSFCIVPYLRGLPQSVPIREIVNRINTYPNYSEAILTAINTEAYGRDIDETFVHLISSILKNTDIPRISFGSIHPWSLDDDFLSFYKSMCEDNRFVDFFHIPLQSGSNKILSLMKRGYTREEFIQKLKKLSQINPFIFIGTDVIVGFLEETNKDFEDTLTFLKKTPISKFHVFRFSKRQHTAAFYMSKRMQEPSDSTKKYRSKTLRDLSDKKYSAFQRRHIGKTFPSLFLEKRDNEYQHVLLQNQLPAIISSEKDYTGEIKNVKIERYQDGNLIGKII